VRNRKFLNSSTTADAGEKISADLEFLDFRNFSM
jgi:hypothetical protein